LRLRGEWIREAADQDGDRHGAQEMLPRELRYKEASQSIVDEKPGLRSALERRGFVNARETVWLLSALLTWRGPPCRVQVGPAYRGLLKINDEIELLTED
jgi:hypothetical protein